MLVVKILISVLKNNGIEVPQEATALLQEEENQSPQTQTAAASTSAHKGTANLSQTQPFSPKEKPEEEKSNWVKIVQGKKTPEKKEATQGQNDSKEAKLWIVGDGWSVPAYKHYTEIPLGQPGICLVTKQDAPKAME